MPTYEYKCQKCGLFEVSQRITEDALKTCPTCGGAVERLISATAFHLKGGGWYKTDYASGGSSSAPASTETKTGGETKAEPAKTDTPAPAPTPPASTPPTTSSE